jgi:hypothetical protein
VEVGKVLRDDLPQVATCWNKLLHLVLGPFFFSFIDCLEKTECILSELQLPGENKLFSLMQTV